MSRPTWCPQPRQCRPLGDVDAKLCGGTYGDGTLRMCCSFRTAGGGIFGYEGIGAKEIESLRALVEQLDDERIARAERGGGET
jgi:hypothetical protein